MHGYPSRLRVGKGSDEIDQLGSCNPKTACTRQKNKALPTDGRTNRWTGWVVELRARDKKKNEWIVMYLF